MRNERTRVVAERLDGDRGLRHNGRRLSRDEQGGKHILGEYKMPGIWDIPELRTVLLESDAGAGPYGARGIGENPCGPIAPAIANAVADAVGVRIKHLPITAEKVYRELHSR